MPHTYQFYFINYNSDFTRIILTPWYDLSLPPKPKNLAPSISNHISSIQVLFDLQQGLGHSVEDLSRNATFAAEQLSLYINNRTGAYGSIPSSTVAMLPAQSFIDAAKLKELLDTLDESLKVHKGTPTEKQIAVQRALLNDPTVPDVE